MLVAMRSRGLVFGAALLLPVLTVFAGCGGGADWDPFAYPDEPSEAGEGGDGDSASPAKDSGNDATVADVTPPPDAAPDAAEDADAGGGGDASPDASFDGGAPTGPTLLVSDPGGSRIDLVTTTGTILHTFTSPVTNVAGVAYDRRKRDGFWVVGRDATIIQKVAWSGASLPSVTPERAPSALCGLDYVVGATPADDELVYVYTAGVEGVAGVLVSTGKEQFEAGFFLGTFEAGFWGVSMLVVDVPGNVFQGWFSHPTSDSIERWQTASLQQSLPITITEARGLARAANGEFWVVDETTHHVTHLSAAGDVLGGFDTPGTKPAGLSYDPGL
jgi:hypothetical protein